MTARRRRTGSESDQVPLLGNGSEGFSSMSAYQTRNSANLNGSATGAIPKRPLDNSSKMFPSAVASSRDRTSEFASTVRSLQSRRNMLPNVTNIRDQDSRKSHSLANYSEFMSIARIIGKNISSTYTKLEKLTLLAKRRSLFEAAPHKPDDIQELTYIIKEDISSLNKQIAQLQEVARQQRDQRSRHSLQAHSSSVVVGLQSKLASMSTEFKQVLEVRTENLKQQKSRQDQFSQGHVSSSLPPSAFTGYHQGSVLLADERASSGADFVIDMDSRSGPQQSQSQQQQMMMYDQTDSYLQSRAETMQNIESTIVELGGIFQQLAYMVKEQEEIVQRIDTNIEDAELNVEAAHGEILKYFQSVTSNRWLMVKVFAVLIFFFILFVVFLA